MKTESQSTGFTLIEVIISVALIGVVLAGLFSLHAQSLRLIEDSRYLTRAGQILQSEMESMRTLNWNDISDLPYYSTFQPSGQFADDYINQFRCYRYLLHKNDEQRHVLLITQWTNSRGQDETRVFHTIFTKDGINDYYYRAF